MAGSSIFNIHTINHVQSVYISSIRIYTCCEEVYLCHWLHVVATNNCCFTHIFLTSCVHVCARCWIQPATRWANSHLPTMLSIHLVYHWLREKSYSPYACFWLYIHLHNTLWWLRVCVCVCVCVCVSVCACVCVAANKSKVLWGIPRDPDIVAALQELEEEENEMVAEDEKPKVRI